MQVQCIPLWDRYGNIVTYALVDAADFEMLNAFRWHRDNHGYARRNRAFSPSLMHRLLLELEEGDPRCGDHINRARLDNRRANLRVVSHAENQQNLSPRRVGTSRFRSVYWAADRGKWRARVVLNGRRWNLGYFHDEVDAARAAEAFRREHMPFAAPDEALAALG